MDTLLRAARHVALAFLVPLLASAPALAQVTTNWTDAGGGNFNDSGNWSNGIPTSSDDAVFNLANTYTVTLTQNQASDTVLVGNGNVTLAGGFQYDIADSTSIASSGELHLSAGTLSTSSFDNSAGGTFLHTNGTLIVDGGTFAPVASGPYRITAGATGGSSAPGNPVVTLRGVSTVLPGLFGNLAVGTTDGTAGNTDSATLNLQAGAQLTANNIFLGGVEGDADVVLADVGSSLFANSTFNVGESSRADLTVGSGTTVSSVFDFDVGKLSTGNGTVVVAGTIIVGDDLNVGGRDFAAGGTGVVTLQNGGRVTVADDLQLWGDGTLTINSGNLNLGTSSASSGMIAPTLHLNGGTVNANSSTVFAADGTLNLSSGTLATDSFNNTAGGTFNHTGGTLRVTNGVLSDGSSTSTYLIDGANNPTIEITGGSSSWNRSSALRIGNVQSGTLKVEAGATVTSASGSIGTVGTSSGLVMVTGANSTWTNTATLRVGDNGTGTLRVEAGATVTNNNGTIGFFGTSTSDVTVTGANSKWTNTGVLRVGENANGTLKVEAGGEVTNTVGFIGTSSSSTSNATVTGANSKWTNSSTLSVGYSGNGTLNVLAGGEVTNSTGTIGEISGSTGDATVSGTDSRWVNSGSLYLGGGSSSAGGTATLTIDDDGFVDVAATTKLWGGATLNLSGGTLETVNFDNSAGGTFNHMGGTLTVHGGSYIPVSPGTTSYNIDGASDTRVVLKPGTTGSVDQLRVGENTGNFGSLRIENNAEFTANFGTVIGFLQGSEGEAVVSGINARLTTPGQLNVGDLGDGTLLVEQGGQVNLAPGSFRSVIALGSNSTGQATVTGSGSAWNNANPLHVGRGGDGELLVEQGGTVTNTDGFIGVQSTAIGQVTLSGGSSSWINSGSLYIGGSETASGGSGTLTIVQNGGVVDVAGATKLWSGGVLNLYGGDLLTGSLDNSAGGTINHSGGTLRVANGAFSDGAPLVYSIDGPNFPNIQISGVNSSWVRNGLQVGNIENGTLEISDEGTVETSGATLGVGPGSEGFARVTDASWEITSFPLIVGHSGQGTLIVESGSAVNSINGRIAALPGSTGNVSVVGTNSEWVNFDTLAVGGSSSNAGGTGELTIASAGVVTAGLRTVLWSGGTIILNGGTLNTDSFDDRGGTLDFRSGTLRFTGTAGLQISPLSTADLGTSVTVTNNQTIAVDNSTRILADGVLTIDGGTFESHQLELNASGALNFLNGSLTLTGGTTDLDLTVPSTGQLNGSGTVNGEIRGVGGSNISAIGPLALGDATSFLGFTTEGTLDVGAHTVTLNSRGFANLGALTTITGGTLNAANGVALGTGDVLQAGSSVNGRIAAGFGSIIDATGNLTLGDATSVVGFTSDGELYTNQHTVTINDANESVLGSLTHLGSATDAPNSTSDDGRLIAEGSNTGTMADGKFLLEEGKNLTGDGVVEGDFRNMGNVIGAAPPLSGLTETNDGIVFENGTVTGIGSFVNVLHKGTYAPGLSPAIVTGENQAFGGIVQLELGGTVPGSGPNGHDQIIDNGTTALVNGVDLEVMPWNGFEPAIGDEFEVLVWEDELVGTFDEVRVDEAFALLGIDFALDYGANSLTLVAIAATLAGDFDADGEVTGGDFLAWQRGESPDPLSGSDLAEWQVSYPNAAAAQASSTAVPEPCTCVLMAIAMLFTFRRRFAC